MSCTEILKTAVYAGYIMLSNGAETYRVEDTMKRILETGGFNIAETFVTTTGVFASIEEKSGEITTLFKRIKSRTFNLNKIALVNNLSRDFVEKRITIDMTMKRLDEIHNMKGHSSVATTISFGVSCFCFTYMTGGNIVACSNAFFIGVILNIILIYFSKIKLTDFLVNIFGGMIITTLTLILITLGFNSEVFLDKVIIGSIIPLLPGLGITNAVRDILEGDYLSGSSRIVDATLVAVCIASGVGVVLKIWIYFFGGLAI